MSVTRWAFIGVLMAQGPSLGAQAEPAAGPYSRMKSARVRESSGLVASRRSPGLFWTHNDSGDRNRIFAIRGDGKLVSEVEIEGATNVDWEDLAIDDRAQLYIADSGNNDERREDLSIYVIDEPDVRSKKLSVRVKKQIRFRYPGRLRFDAEAIFWTAGHLYLLTKHRSDTKTELFRFDDLSGRSEQVLQGLGMFDVGGDRRRFGGMVTAADITPDGRYLAVLSYHALFIFERPVDSDRYLEHLVRKIDFDQRITVQCEAISWVGKGLVFTNEDGTLHRIPDVLDSRIRCYPTASPMCQ